jgi:hypothetical protein
MTRSPGAAPRYVVPPTTTFHLGTVVLAAFGLCAAAYGVRESGWLRWFLVVIALAALAVVVNRARARVVVTSERIHVGHEVGTTRIARRDVSDLELVRDGFGWAPRIVLRDRTERRVTCLASWGRGEAAIALEELRVALDSVPADPRAS